MKKVRLHCIYKLDGAVKIDPPVVLTDEDAAMADFSDFDEYVEETRENMRDEQAQHFIGCIVLDDLQVAAVLPLAAAANRAGYEERSVKRIAVMNYSDCSVTVSDLPESLWDAQSDEIEDWLTGVMGYSMGEVYYMTGRDINVTVL